MKKPRNNIYIQMLLSFLIFSSQNLNAAGGAGGPPLYDPLEGLESEPTCAPLIAHQDLIRSTCQEYVEIYPEEVPEPQALHKSKYGGKPFLPSTIPYPGSPHDTYFLLAQLNFEEMPRMEPLPDKGLLQIYVPDSPELGMEDDFKVIYIPEVALDAPQHDLSFLAEPSRYFPIKREHGLAFNKKVMPLTADDRKFEQVYKTALEDPVHGEEFKNIYSEVFCGFLDRVGGYPDFDQSPDPRSLEDDRDFLLLHIGSAHPSCINWGDGGQANFFINPAKLAARDFSDILYFWDAS